jgi:hypothetical protein
MKAAPRHTLHDPQKDFDFLFGRWNVRNRRLRERLAGSDEWLEFDSTIVARPVWDGLANLDEYDAPHTPWGRIRGLALRIYDPVARQWSIYWGNQAAGKLDQPMIGGFIDGRGEFYDQEIFQGRAIYARFVWSVLSESSAQWEQAYSEDGGRNWETNWVMRLARESSWSG